VIARERKVKFVRRFVWIDSQFSLQNTRSAIEFLSNEVDSTAVPLVTGIEYALMCVEARVSR
jgi:hypothetical protein